MGKWFKVLMVAIVFAVMATSLTAQCKEPSLVEIDHLAKQIAKDNPKFSNPNLIYPGDTVRVNERVGKQFRTSVYNVAPWMTTSENGCLWQISKLHLKGEIVPEKIINQTITDMDEASNKNLWTWLDNYGWILGILLSVLLVALMLAYYARKDPDAYPPVIEGGLSQDPVQAAAEITRNYPTLFGGKALKEVTRGVMRRHSGPTAISVVMQFGDGMRTVRIKDGDAAYKAEYVDGAIHYFRQHCGNLYAPIASGQFKLPNGWSFESQQSVEMPASETQPSQPQPEAKPQTPAAPKPEAPTNPVEPNSASKITELITIHTADPKEVEIEIGDGSNKLIVKAKGDQEHMPTKIEHGGGKTIIFFPYKPENK
ncbi:hypothetical protein JW977_03065 [Candidatus Falkowbacteria bacterium]|nr:hypothetical protein [Candidatus Falkowbacteria bacterium]